MLDITSSAKTDKSSRNASAEIKVSGGGTEEQFEVFNQDGKKVLKTSSSNVYQVMSGNDHWKGKTHKTDQAMDATLNQEVENVIDELVGNLKNYVTVSPQEDGKEVHRLPAERRPNSIRCQCGRIAGHQARPERS
ncbi:hypothetical protein LJK87_14990 [Paenibacillus sp. P25]|nr:hypothetical protein LJK87_14990 [Paenibacillus sp. P25]